MGTLPWALVGPPLEVWWPLPWTLVKPLPLATGGAPPLGSGAAPPLGSADALQEIVPLHATHLGEQGWHFALASLFQLYVLILNLRVLLEVV